MEDDRERMVKASAADGTPDGPPRWWGWALASALVAFGAYQYWASSPENLARRLCARRYNDARTAADTAALDPIRTMGRGGVVAKYTCGELRISGKL